MARRVDVAVGVLVERDDDGWRVFITRRPDHVVYAGYWELPGGKIEPGESPRDCLRREFREEVDLDIEVGAELAVIEHHYPHAHVRLHPFFCRRIDGQPRNLQVVEHRWVRLTDLENYQFPEANITLMAEVRATLASPQSDQRIR